MGRTDSFLQERNGFLGEQTRYKKVSTGLKIVLPYNPGIPFLGIYPKKTKTLTRKDICTPMFTAALLTIAKIWKQPKCSSMDEWIKKM